MGTMAAGVGAPLAAVETAAMAIWVVAMLGLVNEAKDTSVGMATETEGMAVVVTAEVAMVHRSARTASAT